MNNATKSRRGHYLSVVRQCPVLSADRERELARRWRALGDASARDLLVLSQLRHVVAIARRYRRYNCVTLEELIAEGNFGLVHALAKFDPERGTRLVTYAAYWIRAYISQFLVRSRSLVSTGVRSKVLSKIRRARAEIVKVSGEHGDVNDQIAERLALSPEKLHSFLARVDVHDVSWDSAREDIPNGFTEPPGSASAEQQVLSAENSKQLSDVVSDAMSKLDQRERYIVERRLMAQREDTLTLAEIGRRFGISRERARQLETRAVRKLKAALSRASLSADWLAGCYAA